MDDQKARLQPYSPKSHGKPRVDDRRVLNGIIFVNRNGLRWRDAPKDCGPHKTLYNRWKRWGETGVFVRMLEGLAAAGAEPKTDMIDATHLKAHRDKRRYKRRNRIESMFGRLKDWRRVATRYDRCPTVFFSAIALAATVLLWL
jgi:transposase